MDFTVCKVLLKVSSFCWATKNIDIYSKLVGIVNDYGGFDKCACIVTDGASTMTRQKNGLVSILKDRDVHCSTFYCIIHEEALCTYKPFAYE